MDRGRGQAHLYLSEPQIHILNNYTYFHSSERNMQTAPIHFPKLLVEGREAYLFKDVSFPSRFSPGLIKLSQREMVVISADRVSMQFQEPG